MERMELKIVFHVRKDSTQAPLVRLCVKIVRKENTVLMPVEVIVHPVLLANNSQQGVLRSVQHVLLVSSLELKELT
jgi:hypothetical protein